MSLEDSIDRLSRAVESAIEKPLPSPVFHVHQITEQTVHDQFFPPSSETQLKRIAKGAIALMLDLTDSQKVTLSVAFKDKKGNAATVDGKPSWGSDNTDVVSLVVSDDGLSCEVSAVGPLGSALISVQADADLGQGVTEVAGTLQINVKSGAATTVAVVAGDVSEQ